MINKTVEVGSDSGMLWKEGTRLLGEITLEGGHAEAIRRIITLNQTEGWDFTGEGIKAGI